MNIIECLRIIFFKEPCDIPGMSRNRFTNPRFPENAVKIDCKLELVTIFKICQLQTLRTRLRETLPGSPYEAIADQNVIADATGSNPVDISINTNLTHQEVFKDIETITRIITLMVREMIPEEQKLVGYEYLVGQDCKTGQFELARVPVQELSSSW